MSKRFIREKLFDLHKGLCHYCGRKCVNPRNGKKQKNPRDLATLDHKTPLARGGTYDPENLVLACHGCNNEKGNLTEQEYKTKKGQA